MTLGGVFGVLGALIVLVKHRAGAGIGLTALGGILIVLGLVAPALLTMPHRGWRVFSQLLGRVNTAIFLSIVFFLILTPVGLVFRLFGRDELRRRRPVKGSMWIPYSGRVTDTKHFERMF